MQFIIFLSIGIVTILPILPIHLIYLGLQQPLAPKKVYGGVVTLASICLGTGLLAMTGSYGGVLGFLLFALSFPAIVISAIILAIKLPKHRKIVAALIGIVYPVALVISLGTGSYFSKEALTRRDGEKIAQALETYHKDTDLYPQTLSELVPSYLPTIPKPRHKNMINDDWHYESINDTFVLGFSYTVNKDTVPTTCYYDSQSQKWTNLAGGRCY